MDNEVFFDEDEMFVHEIDINMMKKTELIAGDEETRTTSQQATETKIANDDVSQNIDSGAQT